VRAGDWTPTDSARLVALAAVAGRTMSKATASSSRTVTRRTDVMSKCLPRRTPPATPAARLETVNVRYDVVERSDRWRQTRCGCVTVV
jgi:hypothetical protein